mmetsp:Transcript_144345/g.366431  ORF Transcript_144345/g.366431 Transcript_144345/m.366431 type:complete len:234 (+) Transcript_144345:915-1616(+)
MLAAGRELETPQLLLLYIHEDAIAARSPRRLEHKTSAARQLATQFAHRLLQLFSGRSNVAPRSTSCGREPNFGSWQCVPKRRATLLWIDVRMKPSLRTAKLANSMIRCVPDGWHPIAFASHNHGGGQIHGVEEQPAKCHVHWQRRHHLVEGRLRWSRFRPGGTVQREGVKPQSLPCVHPVVRRPSGPKLLHLPKARKGYEVNPGPHPWQATRAPLNELVVAPRLCLRPPREED